VKRSAFSCLPAIRTHASLMRECGGLRKPAVYSTYQVTCVKLISQQAA